MYIWMRNFFKVRPLASLATLFVVLFLIFNIYSYLDRQNVFGKVDIFDDVKTINVYIDLTLKRDTIYPVYISTENIFGIFKAVSGEYFKNPKSVTAGSSPHIQLLNNYEEFVARSNQRGTVSVKAKLVGNVGVEALPGALIFDVYRAGDRYANVDIQSYRDAYIPITADLDQNKIRRYIYGHMFLSLEHVKFMD